MNQIMHYHLVRMLLILLFEKIEKHENKNEIYLLKKIISIESADMIFLEVQKKIK